jgi:dolichol kinase
MSYGDGFASIIGVKYGKNKYNVFGDEKSYIGSTAMFIFTFLTVIIAVYYYQIPLTFFLLGSLVLICFILTIVEGLTPKGIDNLTVPFIGAFIYWFIFLSGVICV